MDLNLDGKVALVAGSTRGIGFATARAFLRERSRTVVTGRDLASLARARDALGSEFGKERVMACEGDLCDPDVVASVLSSVRARWDRVDCLVANIGSGRGVGGWDVPEADWNGLIDDNFSCSRRLVQETLREMVGSRRGSVVFVASIVALESTRAPLPYSAAKAAIVNLSKNLARQVGPHGVRVNSVAPGNILFPGGSWERHLLDHRGEVMKEIEAEVPMQRFGRPEEVADVIVFLSSDRAAFITGSCVVVDGGQTRSI
jgi:3-oxoacyl-[acyl-carrier protein] reductase